MKEQDFIQQRAPLRARLAFMTAPARAAAAAAASAVAAALSVFVLAVLPPHAIASSIVAAIVLPAGIA